MFRFETGFLLMVAVVMICGVALLVTSLIDDAFSDPAYPALLEKVPASGTQPWTFRLADGFSVKVPYSVWASHQPGDKIYVQAHRSFLGHYDVAQEGQQ